jgi:serine/threonine-protein kinase RIO1
LAVEDDMGTPYFQSYFRNLQKVWAVGALRPEPAIAAAPVVVVGPLASFDDWRAAKLRERARDAEPRMR